MKYFRINLIKNVRDMHSVIYMSKLIESYILNMCYLWHVKYISVKLFLKGIRKNNISVIHDNHV